MTRARRLLFAVCVVVSVAFASCSRGKDYLFEVPPAPPPPPQPDVATLSFDHPLKGLSGTDKLDVIWVIDNSNSMDVWQNAVIQNTQEFINLFTQKNDLKWKMGLLSTDAADKPYVGFTPNTELDWTTPDPVTTFQNAVKKLGVNGDSTERTFAPIMSDVTVYPFIRKGSFLSVILVSDAPEQSGIPGDSFLAFMNVMTGGTGHWRFYGVLDPKDYGCLPTDDAWNYEGSPFQSVIEGTEGFLFLLCDGKFAKNLLAIGQDMVTRTSSKSIPFPNGVRPLPASIRVLFHGNSLPGGLKERGGYWIYDYDQNSVDFNDLDFATGENESVHIEYQLATQ